MIVAIKKLYYCRYLKAYIREPIKLNKIVKIKKPKAKK